MHLKAISLGGAQTRRADTGNIDRRAPQPIPLTGDPDFRRRETPQEAGKNLLENNLTSTQRGLSAMNNTFATIT